MTTTLSSNFRNFLFGFNRESTFRYSELFLGFRWEDIQDPIPATSNNVVSREEGTFVTATGDEQLCVGDPVIPFKPHILDKKYPHVCFKCKKSLKFGELFMANRKDHYFNHRFDIPLYRKLKKLWRSQVIEFYCCECYLKKG